MIRVLYVDDEPDILDIGKEILEKDPEILVEITPSVDEAISLLAGGSFDAIITDYLMPGMDGIAFLTSIRADHPDIPFIIFTAQGDEATAIQALNSGADYYLKKSSDTVAQFLGLARLVKIFVSRYQSDEIIRKSEKKFRNLFNSSVDAIIYTDLSGKIQDVNPAFVAMTGYSEQEIITKTWKQITPEKWHIEEEQIIRNQVLIHGYSDEIEKEYLRKNGDVIPISLKLWLIQDEKDQPTWLCGLARDITNRKKSDELLKQEHQNFLTLFSLAPVGLLLIDKEARITNANELIRKIVQRDISDIIGERAGKALGCIHSKEEPEGCGFSTSCPNCPLRQEIDRVLTRATHIHGAVIELTVFVQGIPETHWLSMSAEPVEINGSRYVIMAIDDITGIKKVEEELRESEEKFRMLSETTPVAIMMYQDHKWIYANPAAHVISGYSQKELLSMNFWDVIHPDYRDTLRGLGEARLRGEITKPRELEMKILRKDGNERWINLISSTIFYEKRPAGLLTAIDITARKIAEENLIKSEEKYRSIFENQIDLYFQSELSGITLTVSPSSMKLTGFSPEELIGQQILDLFPISEQRSNLLATLLENNIIQDYEIMLLGKNNQIPVSVNAHIIRDHDGKPHRIEGTIRDISERKRAEEAIINSEKKYRQLHESLMDAYASVDMKSRIIEFNSVFEQMVGYSPDEIQRLTYLDLTPEKWHAREQEILTSQVFPRGYSDIYEKEYIRKDGTTIPIELRTVLSRDSEGKPAGMWAIIRDITDRKNKESRLEVQSQILETIAEGVCLVQAVDDKIVYTNPKFDEMFGYERGDLLSRSILLIHTPEDPEITRRRIEEIKQTLLEINEWSGVVKVLKKDGTPVWCLVTISPFDHPKYGKVFITAHTDITDRKRSEDALALASRKLNLMSSITRHDILNQLTALSGYIELSKDMTTDPRLQEFIRKEKVMAEMIVHEISFTKDYQEMGIQSPVWQNVNGVIRNVVQSLPLEGYEVIINLPELEVFADLLFEKVFYNLIDNALRYGGEKMKHIRISSESSGKDLLLICENDGEEISPEDKLKLFTRGFGKHTGLGLFLTREILSITDIAITETGISGARFEMLIPKGIYRYQTT